MEIISSNKNEKIKNISALLRSKKTRDEQGVFVIEGIRLFRDTLKTASGYIDSIYLCESFGKKDSEEAMLLDLIHESVSDTVPINIVKDSVFEGVSDTVTTQGVLAIVKKPKNSLADILKNDIRLLVLENIQDPGNLGTMLRTAEAAGMTGIVLSGGCVDIFSPKVVRASMGSIFRMPFVYCDDFVASMKKIKEYGVTIYAAYLHGGTSYKNIEFDEKHAILIGNEGNGLTDSAVEAADNRIFIPMAGEIESLNAAIAAAILMYK